MSRMPSHSDARAALFGNRLGGGGGGGGAGSQRAPPSNSPQPSEYAARPAYGSDPRARAPPPGQPSPGPRYNEKPPMQSQGQQGSGPTLQIVKLVDWTKSLQISAQDMAHMEEVVQNDYNYGNRVAVSSSMPLKRGADGADPWIIIRGGQSGGEYVVTAKPLRGFPQDCIGMTETQRKWCNFTLQEPVVWEPYEPFQSGGRVYLSSLELEIGFASTRKTVKPYDEDKLIDYFIKTYENQFFAPHQRILMKYGEHPLLVVVRQVELADFAMSDSGKQVSQSRNARGMLSSQTTVVFQRDGVSGLKLIPSESKPNPNAILAPDFKFEDMGVGGLGTEFATIFRRAFASRMFPPGLVARMGIPHVKGMLLYGPPGTGKTLMARQIGNLLNAQPPKVINGPEVLNKYVGQSEENIRNLFKDAEKEYAEKGDESSLHVIIFDELDAVCKQRGSGAGGGTGVGDSVVNQLLSKLDGVNQLNNILLIGMTNRKDMIDDALMRPGRLEVHLEITLPDEPGRLEILKIHTTMMRENNKLSSDVNLAEIAGLTKNFSGAELNGLVKAASSFALSRHTETDRAAVIKDVANLRVCHDDFLQALNEVHPAYGVSEAELDEATRLGIMSYSPHIDSTIQEMKRVVNMIKDDPNKFNTSVLFHGPRASGKTALAAHIALESGFPFIKMVTPADLVPYRDDFAKKDYIHKAFADAYKSPASILILDDFERMIGWNAIGPRFSNTMLEALTTLLVSKPPKGHRLLVFVTSSKASVLKMLEIDMDFAKKVAVPAVGDLQQLGNVLQDSGVFSASDANAAINMIHERTGGNNVGVGIKSILDCIFEARAGGDNIVETLVDLLLEKMQELN